MFRPMTWPSFPWMPPSASMKLQPQLAMRRHVGRHVKNYRHEGGAGPHRSMTERLKALFASMERGRSSDLVFPNTRGPGSFRFIRPSSGGGDSKLNEGVTNPKLRASFHSLRHTAAAGLCKQALTYISFNASGSFGADDYDKI